LRLRLGLEEEVVVSTDVVDALLSFVFLARARASEEGRGDLSLCMCMDGKMSFFCFEAGRISSRSTGTPSETRKRRRMRERTQSGGCNGGGATSCVHRDLLRSVEKMECASSVVDMDGVSWSEG